MTGSLKVTTVAWSILLVKASQHNRVISNSSSTIPTTLALVVSGTVGLPFSSQIPPQLDFITASS